MPGRNRVDTHADIAELAGKDPGHTPHGRLAGYVVHEAGGAKENRARRDVDDDATALLSEHWRDCYTAAPDAANIDGHDPIPLVDRNRVECLGRSQELAVEGGIVDQDVDPPVSLHGSSDHALHAGIVGHVYPDSQAADFIGDFPRTFLGDVGDDHTRALSSQGTTIPCPESTPSSGHNGDFAFE